MAAFTALMVAQFAERMTAYLCVEHPTRCHALGANELRSLITRGIAYAEAYGLTTERSSCVYIEAMLLFGERFDTLPWARELLAAQSGIDVRAQRLRTAIRDCTLQRITE